MDDALLRPNPAKAFFASKATLVASARRALLARMEAISPALAQVVVDTISERQGDVENPSLGEAWPWLLADLAGIPNRRVRSVSQAWEAIYFYTLLLDRQCDEPWRHTGPEEVLAGSLLFEIGLGDLIGLTAGTPWQKLVRGAIEEAIRGQMSDVAHHVAKGGLEETRASAAGKNSGFVVCAAAFAVVADTDPTALVDFTRSTLLALQHLDDLGDFETDYRVGNFTPLLSLSPELLRHEDAAQRSGTPRPAILAALAESGALDATLTEAKTLLKTSYEKIMLSYSASVESAGRQFLRELDSELEDALRSVRLGAEVLRDCSSSETDRRRVVDDIEHRLRVVAQQS